MSTPALSIPEQPPPFGLSDPQQRAIAAISSGHSTTDAARQLDVHRNTIHYWRRTNPSFRDALTHALYDRALFHREHAEALAPAAIDTIKAILDDPKAAPSVRLRAALAILQTATTPPPEPPPCTESAQLHKSAQTPHNIDRTGQPKTGRNDDCPCGSGLKFKRCCLNKPAAQAAPKGDPPIPAEASLSKDGHPPC
jgi:transposase-like protein